MQETLSPIPHGISSFLSGMPLQNFPDQNLYQQVFEKAADAFFLRDETGLIDCNQAYLDILGYTDKTQLLSTHFCHDFTADPGGRNGFRGKSR